MKSAFIDTDILIRLLTGDDLKKQAAAVLLFEKVEQKQLVLKAPETVIADCIYVLSSPRLYDLERDKIRDILMPLLRLTHFKITNKQIIQQAIEIFSNHNLDFSDAYLAVLVKQHKLPIYSYDRDFDKIGIKRIEP